MKAKGFSTVEIMIAMAIMVLALGAVILVAFGNQSIIADSQINAEAIAKAEELLEKAQADARKDFRLVNSTSATDGIFQKSIVITQPDYFTKNVEARISWTGEHGRALFTSLTARVTNFENAVGGDTCYSDLSGHWQTPQKVGGTDYSFATDLLVPPNLNTYPITDINAYKNKLYVTVNPTADINTFFIFDITNKSVKPPPLGSLNNSTVAPGLNAVAVAEYPKTSKVYAYVANAYGASFSTCTQAQNCAQMQVIDVTNPVPTVVVNYKIPSATSPFVTGAAGQAIGNAIFYKDGYIYLGLSMTAGGPQFNIIDVHDPLNPLWNGGYSVGDGINSIYVRNNYAYVSSPNSQKLKVLNVKNPGNPTLAGSYSPGGGNGKSISVIGDRAYLGLTVGGTEFSILNNTDPEISPLPLLGSKPDVDSSINGLVVRDYLAFLLTNIGLNILRVDSAGAISQYTTPYPVPLSSINQGRALDCEGNYLYAGYVDSANKGYLSIITAP